MARAGDCKPYNARFQDLPFGSCLYLVEIGEAIKVGRTRMARHRLTSLREEHAKVGEGIGRVQVLPITGDEYARERRAIHALTAVAKPLPRRREYFTGIDYDTALAVVRSTLA